MAARGIGAAISGFFSGYNFGEDVKDRGRLRERTDRLDATAEAERLRGNAIQDENQTWARQDQLYQQDERVYATSQRDMMEGIIAEAARRTDAERAAATATFPAVADPSTANAPLTRGINSPANIPVTADGPTPQPQAPEVLLRSQGQMPNPVVGPASRTRGIPSVIPISGPVRGRNDPDMRVGQPMLAQQPSRLESPFANGLAANAERMALERALMEQQQTPVAAPPAPRRGDFIPDPLARATGPAGSPLQTPIAAPPPSAMPSNDPDVRVGQPQAQEPPRPRLESMMQNGLDANAQLAAQDQAAYPLRPPSRGSVPASATPPPPVQSTAPAAPQTVAVLSEAGTPSAKLLAKEVAATNAPQTPAQAERAAESYADTYRRVGAPYVEEQLLRLGRVADAQVYRDWTTAESTRSGLEAYGQAAFAAARGDMDGFSNAVIDLYNNEDFFPDGFTVDREQSQFIKDADGNILGAQVALVDKDGNVSMQTWEGMDDMVVDVLNMVSPERAFELRLAQMGQVQGAATDAAGQEAEKLQAAQERVADIVKGLSEDLTSGWGEADEAQRRALIQERIAFEDQAAAAMAGTPQAGASPGTASPPDMRF